MGCCKKNNCCKSQSSSMDMDYLVCTCMGVLKSEVIEAIDRGNDTFEQLSQELGVGTGCSSCVEEVHQILEKSKQEKCCKQ